MKRDNIVRNSLVITLCITTLILSITAYKISEQRKGLISDIETGKSLVEALYEYNDLMELQMNQETVKDLVTPEVFNQINIDADDRGLRVYLKFKGGPTKVDIQEVGRDYVIYGIVNDHIEEYRSFVLFYSLGDNGKINWIRESEVHDF